MTRLVETDRQVRQPRMIRLPSALAAGVRLRRRLARRIGRAVSTLAVVALLAGCDGGSGQSGSAFVFLTVDGFSVGGGAATGSVNSSVATGTTTTACVTLRNNLKNPTITGSSALDNVVIQSYTLTLTLATGANLAGPLTFGAAALIPAGTVTNGVVSNNTGTFAVILVPANVKGGIAPGTAATAQLRFRGRDGRGNSVETEGAVTVVFVAASVADSSCGGSGTTATVTP
jgi:hypothetical protein